MNIFNFESPLRSAFLRHRILFWYDESGEWNDTFEALSDDIAIKIKVEGNEFGTKVRIVRDPDRGAKYLLYLPSARPPDNDNWLLDLLMQGHEFKADRASISTHEAGLPSELRYLAEEHAAFFRSERRLLALKESLVKEDTPAEIRLKMMAIQSDGEVQIDALLLRFLNAADEASLLDPVSQCFDEANLTSHFWREVARLFGYAPDQPSLRDFAVTLFRGANPLDEAVALHPHARVFLGRWKDSQSHRAAFEKWSRRLQAELQIEASLDERGDIELGEADAFELLEKHTLHRLCRAFTKGAAALDLLGAINARRHSFWWPKHSDGYAALEAAVELRELLQNAELSCESPKNGASRYLSSWWRIDAAYRHAQLHLRRYHQVPLMEPIAKWVEGEYVNNFLLPLSDSWGDQVRGMTTWSCEGLAPQRRFFESYVRPFLNRGQKVIVIVSDALRYEAAREFAERLRAENRWTTEVEAALACLPSYTQLGMASLLPAASWNVDATTADASVDDRSARGTANRAEILRAACDGRATALQAEEFLELNAKVEGRALMREHDVIYVFHDRIDKNSHGLMLEVNTFEAVEQAFADLDLIVRRAASINASNMILTADHGFLFQQNDLDDSDLTPLPAAAQWTYRSRRFALGKGIAPTADVKTFEAAELGLTGDWTAAFPLSLGRFPLQGAGKRYVHGGISLQEVVVPVVRLHKARANDTGRVEVELLQVPGKITTGQISLSLYQDRPAGGKVLPRTLRIGVFSSDGTLLSETKTLIFDSAETEARRREQSLLLVLSHAADAFNNREVELRLEETVPGTSQTVIYKTHKLKIQKPFASDFDDF